MRLFTYLCFIVGAFHAFAQASPDALVLYRQGFYEAAIRVTRVELGESPGNMNAYAVQGWSLLALRRYEEAVQMSLDALKIAPFDNRIIQIAGESYYRLGDLDNAEEYLTQYITLTPRGSLADEVYYLLGEIYFARTAYRKADISFSAATYFDGDRPSWWQRLGQSREEAGEFQLALEAYERARLLQPNSSEIIESIRRVSGYIE